MSLNIGKKEIDILFPFHFMLNRDFQVISIGPSLKKLCRSDIISKKISDVFKFKRPSLSIKYTFESIIEHKDHLFIIELLDLENSILLRGQFLPTQNNSQLLFAGSIWLTDVEDLERHQIKINDFSISDNVTDLLHVLKSEKLAKQDILDLAKDLKSERDKLSQRNKIIESIAKFPDENPYPVLRYNKEVELLYSNKQSFYFLELLNNKKYTQQKTAFNKTISDSLSENKVINIELEFNDIIFQCTFAPIEGEDYVNIYSRDISQKKQTELELIKSERRLSVLYEITKLFSTASKKDQNLKSALQLICNIYNWECGGFWQVNSNNELTNVAYYCNNIDSFQEFYIQTTTKAFTKNKGLIGKAWENKEKIWIEDVNGIEGFNRAKSISKLGTFSGLAYPIFNNNELIGVFDFFNQSINSPNSNLTEMLEAFGILISEYLERINSENALKESEEKYRQIVENASDIIYKVNIRGKFSFVNEVAVRVTGYSKKELLSKSFTSIIRKDYQTKTLDFYKKQIQEKIRSTYFEFPILTKNGEERWIGQSVQVPLNSVNKNEITALANDITERKKSQIDLTVALSRLSSLITNLNTGILLENSKREIVLVNEIFCKTFNIPLEPKQMLGIDCSGAAEQSKHLFENSEKFVKDIENLLEKKEKVIGQELRMKNGKIYERDFIPIITDEEYLGHLWQYKDVTDARNYEAKIHEQKVFYETILNSIPADLVVFSKNHEYLFINPTSVKDPVTRSWLIGKTDYDYFKHNNKDLKIAQERSDSFQDAIKQKHSIEFHEKLINKSGQPEYHLRIMNPIYDENNELKFVIGYGINVTNIKLAEQALQKAKDIAEQSVKSKELFLANMSHEIRTPMNAIVGMSDLLTDTLLNEKQKSYLNAIKKSSQNLLVIINDILDLSKISSGKLTLEKIGFNLRELIDNTINSFKHKAEEKGLILSTVIDSEINEILIGDPIRIGQVFNNLISNSIKFTNEGTIKLICSLTQKGETFNKIKFSVMDTGIGIEKEKIDKIFESFAQADESITRKYGGTGLGLSISKQIVNMYDSDITVDSMTGLGTCFSFEINFPIGLKDSLPKEKDFVINYQSLSGKKILLAEDHEINQFLATVILESWNISVTVANNGLEAIDKLKNENFDLILMDVQMPEMNGYEASQFIRKELKLNIPIIALTANAVTGDYEKCITSGMNDYISKPFDKSSLFKKMSLLINSFSKENKNDTISQNIQLYNLSKLKEMSNDDQFIKKMVALFIENTTSLVNEIENSLDSGNYENIQAIAHKLKPSIDIVCLGNTKDLVRLVERESLSQPSSVSLDKNIQDLIDILRKTVSQLKELKN